MKKKQNVMLTCKAAFLKVKTGIYMPFVYLEMILDILNYSRIKKLEILSTNFEENFEDIILKKEFKYENIVHLKVRFNRRAAFRVYDELKHKYY